MKKDNIPSFIYMFSYSIYLIFTMLYYSFYGIYINSYYKYILVFCVLLLILKEILSKNIKIKDLFFLIVCLALTYILFLHLNGMSMFPLFFFIYSSRNIEFRKIVKLTIYLMSFMLLFIVISSFLGVIPDYVSYNNGRRRHFLGFRYALVPSVYAFNLTALILYLKQDLSLFKIFIIVLINYLFFYYTGSRLSFALSLLLIIFSKYKIKSKIILKLFVLSFPVCCVFSLFMIYNFNPNDSKMFKLNEKLGYRLSLGQQSLNEYSINLFGNDTEFIGNGVDFYGNKSNKTYNYVDCLYLNILEKYGIIFTILFVIMFFYESIYLYKKGECYLLLVLFILGIRGMIDDLGIYLNFNTFLLLFGYQFNSIKSLNLRKDEKKDVKI